MGEVGEVGEGNRKQDVSMLAIIIHYHLRVFLSTSTFLSFLLPLSNLCPFHSSEGGSFLHSNIATTGTKCSGMFPRQALFAAFFCLTTGSFLFPSHAMAAAAYIASALQSHDISFEDPEHSEWRIMNKESDRCGQLSRGDARRYPAQKAHMRIYMQIPTSRHGTRIC